MPPGIIPDNPEDRPMRDHSAPLDCGHPARPEDIKYYAAGSRVTVGDRTVTMTGTEVMFPGYGSDRDGRTCCYPCADAAELATVETADAVTVYADTDGRGTMPYVTSWTGTRLGSVIRSRTYRNGLTGSRMTALTVRTAGGRILHGRYGSDWSQAVTLRPSRSASPAIPHGEAPMG